ncbi:MAG TPA: hypothetical protein VFU88_03605 [Ktedonobacterales bacterium]|nr:hypothetical protein [Ktedonobacterales bacterium]
MTTAPPAVAAAVRTQRVATERRLHGWPLALARLAVTFVALTAVAFFMAGVPARIAQLQALCAAGGDCAPGQLSAADAAALGTHGLSLAIYAPLLVAIEIAFALVYLLVALIIFLRRADGRMALFVSLMLALWGTTFTATMAALPVLHPTWFPAIAALRFLGAAALTLFFYLFPDGHFVPRWARWLALVWVVAQVPQYFAPQSAFNPLRWEPGRYVAVSAGFLAVMVAVQIYRYHAVSGPAQRRQTKWVVLGIGVALAGYSGMLLLDLLAPGLAHPGTGGYVARAAATDALLAAIPISIAIAILRARLYDIDRLINRALVYGSLTAILAALYAASVVVLQLAVGMRAGEQSPVTLAASTLIIAAVFQPLRRRLQRGIDRRFYRRRYDAARAIEVFGHSVRGEIELGHLSEQLLAVVGRTMEPEHISLWLSAPPAEARVSAGAPPLFSHAQAGEMGLAATAATGEADFATTSTAPTAPHSS